MDDDRFATKIVDFHSDPSKCFLGIQGRRSFGRSQRDRLRHQQLLRLQTRFFRQDFRANSLVEHPLVKRVLVDHHHAGIILRYQVSIVHLEAEVTNARVIVGGRIPGCDIARWSCRGPLRFNATLICRLR